MFITLKSRRSRAKGEMEQVASKDASTGTTTHQHQSTKRRPACIACHNRKLRCTGSLKACDRCQSRMITCVMATRRGVRSTTKSSSGVDQPVQPDSNALSTFEDATIDDIDPSLLPTLPDFSASIPTPEILPGDPISLEVMQSLMQGINPQQTTTPSDTTQSTSNNSNTPNTPRSCSCTQNVTTVLSNIEEDLFRLTQLSLDQVIQLQKWLMFQCCTALECASCQSDRSVQTILVLICERILLMYECSAARIAKVAHVQSAEAQGTPRTKGADDYASYYPPNTPGTLFSGVTGVPMETADCEGGICSPEKGSSYSIEEQVCMVHALMKLHIKSFKGLLDWVGGTCEEGGNEARRGKIEALGARLSKATENLDTSAGAIMNGVEML